VPLLLQNLFFFSVSVLCTVSSATCRALFPATGMRMISWHQTVPTEKHFSFTLFAVPNNRCEHAKWYPRIKPVWLLIICPVSTVVVSNTTIPRNNSKQLRPTIQLLILVISHRKNIHVSNRGVKVKVISWHVKQALRQGKCNSIHTQPQWYMGLGGQCHSLAALPPGLGRHTPRKHTPYPFYRKLDGLEANQDGSGNSRLCRVWNSGPSTVSLPAIS